MLILYFLHIKENTTKQKRYMEAEQPLDFICNHPDSLVSFHLNKGAN